MEFKDLLGLTLIAAGIAGGVVTACLSRHARDLFFALMVMLAPMTELYDVNFVSRDFYRGTVRGFEVSVVDILSASVLLSLLLVPRPGQRRLYWPASLGFMIVYAGYCALNVAISEPRLFGLFELSKIARGLMIFFAVAMYVRDERDLRVLLIALALVIGYEGFLALKQRYLWGIHRVFGTLDHSNSLSALVCLVAPVFVAAFNSRLPVWLKLLCAAALASSAVTVILAISRAGVVTLALVLTGCALVTMSYRLSARKLATLLLVAVAVSALAAKSWATLRERFAESTLTEEYSQKRNQGRGYYLRVAHAIAEERPFGVGLNNWSYWVSNHYGPRLGYKFTPYRGTDREPSYHIRPGATNIDNPQAAPAHNLGALTLGELGYPGLLLFALLWTRWLTLGLRFFWRRSQDPMRRVAIGIFFGMLGLWLQSLTEWVFRHSPVFYMFHILLGALAGLCYVRRLERRAQALQAEEGFADLSPLTPAKSGIASPPTPVQA